jgi:dienelactone hydrolase
MDETVGPLKPFKDLTVGLASKNIAVLRYNKRTFEHNACYAVSKKATVKEETVDDAVTAVNYLATLPQIDTSRIFVLGHSQGAMLMPRIINADKKGLIKGAVMMSGNSRPLQDVVIDQYRYFYKLGQLSKEQLDYYISQYSMINNPDFSADNTPKGFALGDTYWWADLKAYNQVEAAKQVYTPLLIMQGARDYQVLAAKDFQGWKDALSNKPNVSFQLYPKLNHVYTEGEGEMSTNIEYFNQANIPSYVIDDISKWIGTVK